MGKEQKDWWPKQYHTTTEVRALRYEVELLRDSDAVCALGMGALAATLHEICGPDATIEELETDFVTESLQVLREYMGETEELRDRLAIEQGERTRPYSLHPYEELARVADVAAAHAYFAFARESGASQDGLRQQPGACNPIFYLTQHELRKRGIETEHMWWFSAGNNHHYLRTVGLPDETFDIDPTWQQYLPDGTDYTLHPHVLVAPTSRFVDTLTIHGVPQTIHHTWTEAKPDMRESTNWWGWDRALEAAFEKDP
jgi:hypothetical protein